MKKISFQKFLKQAAFFFLGSAYRETDYKIQTKMIMLNISIITASFFLIAFAFLSYRAGRFSHTITDLVFLVISLFSLFSIRRKKGLTLVSYILMVSLFLLFFYNLITGGIDGAGAMWSFLFPLYAFFILGIRFGLVFSSVFFLLALLIFLFPALREGNPYFKITYSQPFQYRYLSVYFMITLLSFFYEYIKERIFSSLDKQKNRLTVSLERLEKQDDKIRNLAFYDSLTGLCNRNLLMENLKTLITRANREGITISLLFIDLDRFKYINDTLGHKAGDELLKEAASRIKNAVRVSDIVGRLGGDEFVVLLSAVLNPKHGAYVAEKIIKSIQKPFMLDHKPYEITCSIGLATYVGGVSEDTDLIKKADMAMYRAKERGKNCFIHFNQSMQSQIKEIMDMERHLREGIHNHEFRLYYQPIINLSTGNIMGAEALVRWFRPDGEEILPGRFIDVAEETGLIIDLGYNLMKQALTFLSTFTPPHPDFKLSVNIASKQLRDRRLAQLIAEWIKMEGGNSGKLELEFTERLLFEDNGYIKDVLADLTQLGIALVIDDFGTGFSSLSYLYKFEIDKIKIDRSFIKDILINSRKKEIVTALTAMADKLGIPVVAEGIETFKELNFLKTLECDYGQGFYFAKPMEEKAFKKWCSEKGTIAL